MISRYLLPLLLLAAAGPAGAQNAPQLRTAPAPTAATPAPATAAPAATMAVAPPPVVVSGHWTKRDADAAAQRGHHRRHLQSLVGGSDQPQPRGRRPEGLCLGAERRRRPLAPAAGAEQCARAGEAGDGQS